MEQYAVECELERPAPAFCTRRAETPCSEDPARGPICHDFREMKIS